MTRYVCSSHSSRRSRILLVLRRLTASAFVLCCAAAFAANRALFCLTSSHACTHSPSARSSSLRSPSRRSGRCGLPRGHGPAPTAAASRARPSLRPLSVSASSTILLRSLPRCCSLTVAVLTMLTYSSHAHLHSRHSALPVASSSAASSPPTFSTKARHAAWNSSSPLSIRKLFSCSISKHRLVKAFRSPATWVLCSRTAPSRSSNCFLAMSWRS
mmetsp:Transcript_11897/g.30874  ORF Transcript_11897/g.30874 Transcript_11897/m.30874 type:complete len:215 (-) Transcript_11897:1463-2107(-)